MTKDDLGRMIREYAFVQEDPDRTIVSVRGKRASWLFDFRALLLKPEALNLYAELFLEKYDGSYPFQVCAMESAGIALVAAIVMKSVERKKPVNGLFLRKSRKKDGLLKQIEGTPTGDPVILVDDLINSGSTFDKQIQVLSKAGLRVSDIFVALAFRDPARYDFANTKNIRVTPLFTLQDFDIPMLSSDAVELPRESFETLWHFEGKHPSHQFVIQKSAPVLDNERVYFGADDGIFYALDQTNGAVVWEFTCGRHPEGKGIFSSPAIHNGIVYFGAYDGNVYALDAQTGDKKWSYDDADWIGSSPALAPEKGLLFIGLEYGLFGKRGGIVALNMKDGALVWRERTREFTHGSPLYVAQENIVVIGSNDGVVSAYAADTGAPLWHYQTGGDIKASIAYDGARRLLFFGSMDGTFYALRAQSGAPLHARKTDAGIYSTPLIQDAVTYIASLDKCLYAIDLETWNNKWVYDTGSRVFASPRIFAGALWIGGNDGRLKEIDYKTGKLRSFFQVSERIVNAVAYNEKTRRIFVPTCANELYCIQKKTTDGKL